MDISIYGGSSSPKTALDCIPRSMVLFKRNKRHEMDLENQRNYSLKVELVTLPRQPYCRYF